MIIKENQVSLSENACLNVGRDGSEIKDQEANPPNEGTRSEQAEARTEQAETRSEQAEAWSDQLETESERTLRASELSYRRLFEAAQDGILILDLETGRIKDVNPFLVELLGFSHSEMVGKNRR